MKHYRVIFYMECEDENNPMQFESEMADALNDMFRQRFKVAPPHAHDVLVEEKPTFGWNKLHEK